MKCNFLKLYIRLFVYWELVFLFISSWIREYLSCLFFQCFFVIKMKTPYPKIERFLLFWCKKDYFFLATFLTAFLTTFLTAFFTTFLTAFLTTFFTAFLAGAFLTIFFFTTIVICIKYKRPGTSYHSGEWLKYEFYLATFL